MNIDKNEALKAWEDVFGSQEFANDFAGRQMQKSEYQNNNSEFGWMIDNLFPTSKNNSQNALIILNIKTSTEKGSAGTFKANNRIFQIIKAQDKSANLPYELFEIVDED
ncbi:hypothetical protein [[Mycoplasma] gypis]|uniref:Uncharacterized protein n=1 Tax=[Mycoplasma] gypis TaxID=92404 RepID=A0ABZ2RUS2_9BACT|nr:hypothetical protein [[Mycoplasma] gypis]MBN0919655.1 hypothetical protein [[Mycoplasma] gypis]